MNYTFFYLYGFCITTKISCLFQKKLEYPGNRQIALVFMIKEESANICYFFEDRKEVR